VHGVIARAVGGLRVRLPALVRGVNFVADVARADRVERVLLFRSSSGTAKAEPPAKAR